MTLPEKTILFRLDGAPENDAFLELARSKGQVVYAGLAMTLERGWVPDFVEAVIDGDNGCSLTLVELEATPTAALVGARKYLPESSASILSVFRQYLDRVLQRCRSAADPRADDIQSLKDVLSGDSRIRVWTAAALRRPPEVVERLPLIDQGVELPRGATIPQDEPESALDGDLALSARAHKSLSRSVLILDAVVRGWDKSDASLRAWRNLRSQPLRREVKENRGTYPALVSLLLGQKTGLRLTVNDAARELSQIWNGLQPGRYSEQSVLALINKFLPIDRMLEPNAPVRSAFNEARKVIDETSA